MVSVVNGTSLDFFPAAFARLQRAFPPAIRVPFRLMMHNKMRDVTARQLRVVLWAHVNNLLDLGIPRSATVRHAALSSPVYRLCPPGVNLHQGATPNRQPNHAGARATHIDQVGPTALVPLFAP